MNNVRFATALHILTLLQLKPGELLPSEYIAGSINLNPAMVRKELSNLRNFGLVESKEGKGGGSTLAKPASEILLSDIPFWARTTIRTRPAPWAKKLTPA